jgi:hypothetical protein
MWSVHTCLSSSAVRPHVTLTLIFLHALTMASKDGISRRDDDGKLAIASL